MYYTFHSAKIVILVLFLLFTAACNKEDTLTEKENRTATLIPYVQREKKGEKPVLTVGVGQSWGYNCMAITPDDRFVLTGAGDNTIKLWDRKLQKVIRTFTGHRGSILSLSVSPDGRYLLSGSSDHTAKLWEIENGRLSATLQGHNDSVSTAVFSHSGHHVVTGSRDRTIRVWDLKGESGDRVIGRHKGAVTSVALSPDSQLLVSAGLGDSLKIWDFSNGHLIKELGEKTKSYSSVVFSPDGRRILTGSYDNTVKLWDIDSGKWIRSLDKHSRSVLSVAFAADGFHALSASNDNTIRLWDIRNGEQLKIFDVHKNSVSSVLFSKNEEFFISGSYDNTIKIWETASSYPISSFGEFSSRIVDVAFSGKGGEGGRLLSASMDNRVNVWSLVDSKLIRSFRLDSKSSITCLTSSENNQTILLGDQKGSLFKVDLKMGKMLQSMEGHTGAVTDIALLPVRNLALSASEDKTLNLWNTRSGSLLRTFTGHKAAVQGVAISSEGGYVLSGGSDATVKLWDIDSGKCLRTFRGHKGIVWDVAFSPDGKTALSGSQDGKVKLWDLGTGFIKNTFEGHSHRVNSVGYSTDGKHILSGSSDNTARSWEIESFKPAWILDNKEPVIDVSFLRNNRLIVSSSSNSIKLWDVTKKQQLLKMISEGTEWIALTPDGYYDKSPGFLNVYLVDGMKIEKLESYKRKYNRRNLLAETFDFGQESLEQAGSEIQRGQVFSPTEEKMAPERDNVYALIVGISQYKRINVPAKYADNDAEEMRQLLLDPRIGGLEPDHVETLTGDITRSDIEAALDRLVQVANHKPGLAIFFFSGHGSADRNDAYLLPFDTDINHLKRYGISRTELKRKLLQIESGNVVAFLDSCYSGEGERSYKDPNTKLAEVIQPLVLDDTESRLLFITSSKGDEVSRADDKLKHGIMTHHLLNGLSGDADNAKGIGNRDGKIDAYEIYRYLYTEVFTTSRKLGRAHKPQLIGDPDSAREIVLTYSPLN